jgi:LmbE family N-acetylglucosaminyl deacetylase
MGDAIFYEPHSDDLVLSMVHAPLKFLAAGLNVHIVTITKGGNGGPLGSFNGDNVCGYDGYTHNPVREGYQPLTTDDIGELRIQEGRASAGAMTTIRPDTGVSQLGQIFYHQGHPETGFLPDGFGGNPEGPPLPSAISAMEHVIQAYIDLFPNCFHYTMSPTDRHADHAACGQALRNLKAVNASLANARMFVSKLYWNYTLYPDVKNQPGLGWYPYSSRKAEFDTVIRTRVIRAFNAWCPPGALAVGYHQVAGQFANCFGSGIAIANLWHA